MSSSTKTEDPIARRRREIPTLYRGFYDRAMGGKSRKAAMVAFCLDCMGWDRKEITLCTAPACPLYPYRPYQPGNEEQELEIEVDCDDEVPE